MLRIDDYTPADWPAVWAILEPIVRAGETFACPPAMSEEDARRFWTEGPRHVFVARDETGETVGTFFIKPDQIGLGDHVANCGYAVAEAARGRGLAAEMCLASQRIAKERGFLAMKFNLVVATNEAAVKAWTKCGMRILATIPKAFRHSRLGPVDAHIMFREL